MRPKLPVTEAERLWVDQGFLRLGGCLGWDRLKDARVSRADEDMEPLTDLVTVFLGLGIFNANASRLFRQFHEDRKQGWSMRRLGYLPEVVFAYALARFAAERGEARPAWTVHLSTNLRTWFRQSAAWLEKDGRALS